MASSAHLLIVGDGTGRDSAALSSVLNEQGFKSDRIDVSEWSELGQRNDRPDVVVFDLSNDPDGDHIGQFLAFASYLKSQSALTHIPVVAIGDDASCGDDDIDRMRNAKVDEIILGPLSSRQIGNRLNALARLNTMHEELVRRLNTSSKYGVDSPVVTAPAKDVGDATVLVVGATRDYPIIESTLAAHATLIGALTTETALDYLHRRQFDTVIIDYEGDPEPFRDFCQSVRRNSRLYNLPIVLLANPDQVDAEDSGLWDGVTDVIFKPIKSRELEARIVSLVSELRFRDSLRAIYKEARHMATSDGLTGLYSRGFLMEHLRSMIGDIAAHGGTFSLAYLEIANIAAINQKYGYVVGDRIIRQVGKMMGYLVRGEDLTARYGGARFCIFLPDTPHEAATNAVRRISGVVKNTELTTPEIGEPISVDLICSICEYEAEGEPETLVERARAVFA